MVVKLYTKYQKEIWILSKIITSIYSYRQNLLQKKCYN